MLLNKKAMIIYEYIVDRISQDISPTVREICRDLHIKSTSTVHRYVHELCEQGLILKMDHHNRSIRIPHANVSRVPILGNVAAGTPITAIQDIQGYVPLDAALGNASNLFALRIQGESMVKAGIFDGDVVVVTKSSIADNGTIVVALVEDTATVKTFYRENGYFRLQPENDAYEPIVLDHVVILGKVVASIRYF